MAHARHHHRQRPLWLDAWRVFALTATGVGLVVLLVILAALALQGG